MIDLAGGMLILTLFFTMIACIVLGMGVPTTANYVIMATMAAPAISSFLRQIGIDIPVIAAHMFVFYFGIVADITPPVALAAFAGAGIARANPFKTGITCAKFAIGAFLIPYIFVYNPVLVLEGATWWNVPLSCITALVGMTVVSASMIGFFRAIAAFGNDHCSLSGGTTLIIPGLYTDLIGIAILGAIYLLQMKRNPSNGQFQAA